MKYVLLSLVIFCFSSCSDSKDIFDYKFYNKVTGLPLPESYEVVETHDNGEWITTTTLKVDSVILKKYIAVNNFKPFAKMHPELMGATYLKGRKPRKDDWIKEYYFSGDRGQNYWIYIVDIKRNLLWAEVIYPDWSGN